MQKFGARPDQTKHTGSFRLYRRAATSGHIWGRWLLSQKWRKYL